MRAFVVVVFACMTVAACGSDEGSDQTAGGDEAAPPAAGPGQAGASTGPGGDQEAPPTAGPGEAGELAGPGGRRHAIPGCDDIDARDRLAREEYEQLLDELECVLGNPDRMSPEALETAKDAEALALTALEEPEP